MYDDHVLNAAYAIRNKQLKQRIAELEAALQFYADPANHKKGSPEVSQGFSLVDLDEGERAQRALEGGAS